MSEKLNPEYIDGWTNHGDRNPHYHGGCFVEFSNGEWRVIETRPIHNEEQHITLYHIEKDMVWKDGEPIEDEEHFHPDNSQGGWSSKFRDVLDELVSTQPDHPTDMKTIRKVLCSLISKPVMYPTEKYTIEDDKEEYWETLSKYGISKENFKN